MSFLLVSALIGQPALASAQTEYRIPLKVTVKPTAPTPPISGDGEIDVGDNPTPPVLSLAPDSLSFDVTNGTRNAQVSVLTNNGTAPATISGLASTDEYSVGHDCPSPLPVGVPCMVSVLPTAAAAPGTQYPMALLAPGIQAPAVLKLSTFERTIPGPSPILQLDSSLVTLGFSLKPGELASGSTTLSNVGDADATLGGITSGKGFTVSTDCPAVLPPEGRCTISSSFSSYVPGSHFYKLTLTSGASDAGTSLTYFANVQRDPTKLPLLSFVPSTLLFGPLEPGQAATQTARLINKGTAPAVLQPFKVLAPFSVFSDCPSSLPVGESCLVSVTYTATAANSQLFLATAQDGVTAQLLLDGKVLKNDLASKVTPTPRALQFGEVPVGQPRALQATLVNTGSSDAVVKNITFENNTGVFSQTNDCGTLIAAGASCVISVKFAPVNTPQSNAWVKVTFNDDSYVPLSVTGLGQGAALSVGPSTVQLGTIMLPGTSKVQTVGLSNSGNIPLMGIALLSPDSRLTLGNGDCTDALQPGAGCSLTVQYAPDRDAPISSSFTVSSSNGGSVTVMVKGQALALSASPQSLIFPTTRVGTSAPDQTLTLTNDGQSAVTLGGISMVWGSAQFGQSNNCGSSLAVGASCDITVRYTPTYVVPNSIATQGGLVGVVANNVSVTYSLTGTAVNPQLTLSPGSLMLPSTVVGQESSAVTFTVTNPSTITAKITSVEVEDGSADFSSLNDCGPELVPGARCTVSVRFIPTAVGGRGGVLSVTSSFAINKANLSGQGMGKLGLSTTTVSFPPTDFGKSSAPLDFTVTNRDTNVVSISGMSISQGASDFGQFNNCGTSLASGESCTVSVQFTPSRTGVRTGTWSVVSSLGTFNVALDGNGVPRLTLSATSIKFPSTNVGQSSSAMSIVVRNLTDQTANWRRVQVNSQSNDFTQSSNCDTSLTPGASCTVSVQFSPTVTGDLNGNLEIVSTFGTDTVGLNGTGTKAVSDVEGVTPSGSTQDGFTHYTITFLDTEVGTSSAVRNVKFTNKGDGPLGIQGIALLSGDTDFNQSNGCGEQLAPGASCTIALLFTPSALDARVGQIVLLSDTGNYLFDLGGKGVGAVGKWYPDTTADFGDVAVGSSVQRSFTLQNTGTVAAKAATAYVTGADITIASNSCGTSAAPITLAAGSSCRVTLSYAPTAPGALLNATLTTAGNFVNGPVLLPLTGNSPPPALTVNAAPSGDYGTLTVGTSTVRTFVVRNMGKYADTLAAAPALTGSGFALTGGTCTNGLTLQSNSTCTVNVSASPTTPGNMSATVSFASIRGASAALAVHAQAIQSAYSISGAAGTTTAPVTDFGQLTAGGGASQSKSFYLRDDAGIASVTTSLVSLVGDGSFNILGIYGVDSSNVTKVGCATGTASSTAICNAGAPGRAIRVDVKFTPGTPGVKSATLHFEHNGAQGVSDIELSGTGLFDATGVWSSATQRTVALTAADMSFGTKTPGTPVSKTFVIRNVGTHGGEAVGFTLSGDTSQFKILSVRSDYWGYEEPRACLSGGVLAADKLSTTPCRSDDIAAGGWMYPHVEVTVQFNPTAVGAYTATLTPTTDNGTALPAAITLTGVGQFNPTGAWSTSTANTTAPTSAYLAYGTKTTGTSVDKFLVMRNVGTNGTEAVGFTLSGDTSQFQIVSIAKAYPTSSNNDYRGCNSGGTIASDKLSATPCLTDDIATPYNYNHVLMFVRFAPTAVGNFSVTVTPTTNNGTVLPGAVTLTGTGQFNPTGAWSTNSSTTSAPTASYLAYGSKATGTFVDKVFVVRNVGTNGTEAVGFTLSGDTDHFQIVSVLKAYPDSANAQNAACTAGGLVSTDKLSATPCLADDVVNRYNYDHVLVRVRFAPTSTGNFSATLGTTTNNGTVLPGVLTITGVGQ